MSLLTERDRLDLLAEFTSAQVDHSLVLARGDTVLPAQLVQFVYPARMPRRGGDAGVEQSLADVTFYKEPPFDVQVGDYFQLDGNKGGRIGRVSTDPVLGVIIADGTVDVGVPS